MRPRRGNVIATIAAFLAASAVLALLTIRVRQLSSAPRSPAAAFVILVGPNSEESNRTRGLTLALHSLYHNYLAEHPQPVLLFYADDVPPQQYSPQMLAAVVPPAMATLVEVRSRSDDTVVRAKSSLVQGISRSATHRSIICPLPHEGGWIILSPRPACATPS